MKNGKCNENHKTTQKVRKKKQMFANCAHKKY